MGVTDEVPVALTGDANSMVGSLVMVKVAEPAVTEAPLTAWSPPAVTR
jgi:hypothetical protein